MLRLLAHTLRRSGVAGIVMMVTFGASLAWAADLKEIQARGEIRHLGIRYANFVTGEGDGFDVDLIRGFAREIGVRYTLVYTDFYNVLRDLLGHDVVNRGGTVTLEGEYPVRGDMIASGFTMLPWREQVVLYLRADLSLASAAGGAGGLQLHADQGQPRPGAGHHRNQGHDRQPQRAGDGTHLPRPGKL